jgi:thiamine-phosphate pyrophosphorylase
MPSQIFLVAPPDADPTRFVTALRSALDAAEVSALLIPRGTHDDASYKALVKAVLPWAQGADCAVLIEGEPGDVKALGADGLHVAGSAQAVKDAIAVLKPSMIVGAGSDGTRHDAMSKGELAVDYILFGPLSGPIDPPTRDMAAWWAETMEIPSVLSDPQAQPDTVSTEGCEFVGLGESLWQASAGPDKAMAAIAARLETL